MKAYHFVNDTLRDGSPIPPNGEWLVHEGPVQICESGLHASAHPFDALKYARGSVLCLVECDNIVKRHPDKFVCTKRKIITRYNMKKEIQQFIRQAAAEAAAAAAVAKYAAAAIDYADKYAIKCATASVAAAAEYASTAAECAATDNWADNWAAVKYAVAATAEAAAAAAAAVADSARDAEDAAAAEYAATEDNTMSSYRQQFKKIVDGIFEVD